MSSPRIAICGGGVAALEAVLALRDLLAIRPHIDLIAPNKSFAYHPMAVAEPFGLGRTELFELHTVAEELGAELHPVRVRAIDGAEHCLVLSDGKRLPYDAAIIAVGARPRIWLDEAIPFEGAGHVGALADLLERVEDGGSRRIAFAAPRDAHWSLPLYELALLTASWVAERGIGDVELAVITPEEEPLAVFGAAAARMLRGELADRGIRLHAGVNVEELRSGKLALSTGKVLDVDEVVALPSLEGPRLAGLPCDERGFIQVDRRCRVSGLADVYAAGDGTSFPIKQGGIATQQADVAAEAIAARLGARVEPPSFHPQLRGLLLTGLMPIYLRRRSTRRNGEVAASPLWWPPTKVAGRYLGPYIAHVSALYGRAQLEDRAATLAPERASDATRREALRLALTFADADAQEKDFRSALDWLDVIERVAGVLPAGYARKRESWRKATGAA